MFCFFFFIIRKTKTENSVRIVLHEWWGRPLLPDSSSQVPSSYVYTLWLEPQTTWWQQKRFFSQISTPGPDLDVLWHRRSDAMIGFYNLKQRWYLVRSFSVPTVPSVTHWSIIYSYINAVGISVLKWIRDEQRNKQQLFTRFSNLCVFWKISGWITHTLDKVVEEVSK